MPDALTDIVATGTIRNGKLWIPNRRAFDQQIAQMREGWSVEVAITRLRAARSLEQNRYLWGVVYQTLADYTGYTPEEIHDVCKAKFIPKRVALANGNGEVVGEFVLGGSTRKLKKDECTEYIENIRRWAAESLDCYIPDANEGAF